MSDAAGEPTTRLDTLEDELTASQHSLQLALRAGRMGTWSWDAHADQVIWDPLMCELFGVDAAPPSVEDYFALLHPDDRARVQQAVRESFDTKQGYHIVHRVLRPDGGVRYLEGRADVVVAADCTVRGLRGVTLDVTERELAQRWAERHAAHSMLLAEAGVALASSLEPDVVLQRLAELVVPALADGCEIAVIEPGGSVRRMVHAAGIDAGRVQRRERTPLTVDSDHPIARVLRSGEALRLTASDDAGGAAFGPPSDDTTSASLGIDDAVIVPMVTRGQVIGALALGSNRSRHPIEEDSIPVITDLAGRAALSFDNARLFEQQRHVAATLQRSIVPSTLPALGWVDLAARYWVPGAGVEVGGDFYDVIDEGGAAVLVIGDVCGKGVEAASLTAMVRHTLRTAIAHVGVLQTALEWLHQSLQRHEPDSFVTVALVRVSPLNSGLRGELLVAGHPLPIIVRNDGSTELIGGHASAPGLPIWRPAPPVVFDLAERDSLVLYTDGVTDVPGDAAVSTDEFRAVLAGFAGDAPDPMASGVGAILEARQPHHLRTDDIALLIAAPAR